MECPGRWTIAAIILYLSIQDIAVFGQNVVPEGPFGNRQGGNPTSIEMLNSILTAAATNGVLPDLLTMMQGQPFNQELAKPLSVVPMPSPGCANLPDPINFPNQVARPSVGNQNALYTTALPSEPGFCNAISSVPQIISLPPLPSTYNMQHIAQAVPLENYATCAQNVGAVRPMPIALQPQSQFSEVNPYNVYNQIEPISLPDVSMQPLNLPISPPPQVLPAINSCSGTFEVPSNLESSYLPQPTVLTSDGQQLPLNLQINVPTPTVPAPRVTVVSANPANTPVSDPGQLYSDSAYFPPYYPPQPPIIIEGSSSSSLRNMLPILLLALLSDRGCNNGCGCCCCCSCNSSNSGNNIPIPYPIPIPVNNPVVNTCPYPYSSRNRESRDDGDDDEEKKRK